MLFLYHPDILMYCVHIPSGLGTRSRTRRRLSVAGSLNSSPVPGSEIGIIVV